MGVHGLWRLIEPSGKPVPLESLENKVLAVDISIWLHQAIKGFQDAKGASLPNAHLLGIYHRVCKLLYFKIKPVFVFDGGVPVLKKQTIAKRNQLKHRNQSEADRLQKQLLSTLLKHSAVNKVLSETTKATLASKISPTKSKPSDDDDLYKLPPSQLEVVSSESEDELFSSYSEDLTEDSSQNEASPSKGWNLHTIDTNSVHFKSLPADVRHEILSELKETRKQNSWGRIHEMPKQSGDFSSFQMSRLLRRQAVQSALEEAEKEMGGHSLSLAELESLLTDQGVIQERKDVGNRIASDENTRFLLIKDVRQAMDQAKVNLDKLKSVEDEKSKSEPSKADLEFEKDLEKAIAMSLENEPSTSKISSKAEDSIMESLELADFELEDSENSEEEDVKSQPEKEHHLLKSLKGYMMEYSGLTPHEIAKFMNSNKTPRKLRKRKTNIGENKEDASKSIFQYLDSEKLDSEAKESNFLESEAKESNSKDFKSKESNFENLEAKESASKDFEAKESNFEESEAKESNSENFKSKESNFENFETTESTSKDFEVKELNFENLEAKESTSKDFEAKESNFEQSEKKKSNFEDFEASILVSKKINFEESEAKDLNVEDFVFKESISKNPEFDKLNQKLSSTLEPSKQRSDSQNTFDSGFFTKTMSEMTNSTEDVEIMSSSNDESDDFEEVELNFAYEKSKKSKSDFHKNNLEIVINPNERIIEDDLFSDVFGKSEEDLQKSLVESSENAEKSLEIAKNPEESVKDDLVDLRQEKSLTNKSKIEIQNNDLSSISNKYQQETIDLKSSSKSEENFPKMSIEQMKDIQQELSKESEEIAKEKQNKERLAGNISDQMYQEAQELLQLFGMPYIIAPMEAEAQCAFLEEAQLTDGTITDDSDIWLFGGRTVYKNFFNQSRQVMEFRSQDIEHHFKLTRQQMILLALLVGSDYTTGIGGVGPVTALEILAAFPPKSALKSLNSDLIDGLKKFRKWVDEGKLPGAGRTSLRNKLKNIVFPSENFPSWQVVQAYLEPKIETSKEGFTWGKPDVVGLVDFAKEKFGWTQKKSEDILKPILKRLEETRIQKSIKDYFKTTFKVDTEEILQNKMSKRVKSAVKRIGGKADHEEEDIEQPKAKVRRIRKKNEKPKENPLEAIPEELKNDEEVKILATTKSKSQKRVKEIDKEVQESLEDSVQKSKKKAVSRNIHKKEVIPQKERDKADMLKNKLKAIEVFRKSKQGPGFVGKRTRNRKKVKEDAELSESSSGDD